MIETIWGFRHIIIIFICLIWVIKISLKGRRIREQVSKSERTILWVLALIILASFYLFLSHRQHIINPDDSTMPTPKQLVQGIKSMTKADEFTGNRWLVVDALATGKRFFSALIATILLSIAWGVIIGCFKVWKEVSVLPLVFASFVPPTAAMPAFFILMGTNLLMYVGLIVFGTFPILARAISLAIDEIQEEFIFKTLTLGASKFELIWDVMFKQIFPKVLDAIRLQIGIVVILLIAAEMMCGGEGFGYRIRIHYKLANMAILYPYCAILALFGFLLDLGFRKFNEFLCPWYFKMPIRKCKRIMMGGK